MANADRFLEAIGGDAGDLFKALAASILSAGALSAREKALIALACSVAIRCEDCTTRHMAQAKKLGVRREEMLEAAAIASLIRMGSGLNTASILLDEDL